MTSPLLRKTAQPAPGWRVRFELTSDGGDIRTDSFLFSVSAAQPSNIVFDPGAYAAPGTSLAIGQTLTLDVSGFATDGSHTISCTSITGGDTETGTFHLTIEPEIPKTVASRYDIQNISGVAPTFSSWQELIGGEVWHLNVALACIPNDPTVTMTAVAGSVNRYFVTISVAYTSGCSGKTVRPILTFKAPDGVTDDLPRSYIFNLT